MGEGRKAQEGGDIYIYIYIYVIVQQKPTQHCKAIILQLKKKKEPELQTGLTTWRKGWVTRTGFKNCYSNMSD